MYTLGNFLTGLPSTVRQLCPTGEEFPPAADIRIQLEEGGCFAATADGIWFCVGNSDRYYPYATSTASDALAGLLALYRAWGVTYDPATGFCA